MKHHFKATIFVAVCLSIISCAPKKKSRVPYVDYASEVISEDETINVPYTVENGVKYVSVKVNGLSTDMVFDTGCSMTLISILEAEQLAKRGLLVNDDFLGTTTASIAYGSIVEDAVFNIRTLELTDGTQTIVCRNVPTQVSSNIGAPVLLGNGVLDRVASYTIDNEQRVIKFKLK